MVAGMAALTSPTDIATSARTSTHALTIAKTAVRVFWTNPPATARVSARRYGVVRDAQKMEGRVIRIHASTVENARICGPIGTTALAHQCALGAGVNWILTNVTFR